MKSPKTNTLWHHALFAAILLIFVSVYYHHHDILGRLPYGMHSWAQADRFSIAVNYYDSGMDFLNPRTSNMFPRDRIVGVEFPVIYYVTAALAHVFGRDHLAVCNKVLNILIVCIGLFCLYSCVFRITRNFVLSIFTPLFIFCSPVFAFYTGSFIPDPVAVGIFFIGLYYYIRYLTEQRHSFFYWFAFFMTLASLIKGTIVFYYAALLLFDFCYRCSKEKNGFKKTIPLILSGVLSAACILGWFFHSKALNEQSGYPLFLASVNPFKDFEDFQKYAGIKKGPFYMPSFKNNWVNEYFVPQQYGLLFSLFFAGVYGYMQLGKRYLIAVAGLFFIFFACCFSLFGGQLFLHDYYFIAIGLPFITVILLIGIYGVSLMMDTANIMGRRGINTGLFVAILFTFFFADHQVCKRFQPDYPPYYSHEEDWLKGAADFLDRNHISRNAPIGVLGETPPNISLVYLDRKGLTFSREISGTDPGHIADEMRTHHIRYMVVRTERIEEYSKLTPGYFNGFRFIAQEGEKNLYQLP